MRGMSPRSEEQNRKLREESRARILDAALELFARHGYEATSVRMIAGAAGVSQGLMYNYFGGKDDLLRALFERSIRDVRESFARAGAGGGAEERVERLVRAALGVVRENLRFWRLSYGVRMQGAVLAGLGGALHEWAAEIVATLEGLFRDAGTDAPETEAAILFALIDGVAQHYALDPERYPLDAVADRIVLHYRRLAAAASPRPPSTEEETR